VDNCGQPQWQWPTCNVNDHNDSNQYINYNQPQQWNLEITKLDKSVATIDYCIDCWMCLEWGMILNELCLWEGEWYQMNYTFRAGKQYQMNHALKARNDIR
jgi:hypothetical protein